MTFFVNGISIIFTACLLDGIICSIGKISCLREWGAAYARLEGPRSGCRQAMEAEAGSRNEVSSDPAKRGSSWKSDRTRSAGHSLRLAFRPGENFEYYSLLVFLPDEFVEEPWGEDSSFTLIF